MNRRSLSFILLFVFSSVPTFAAGGDYFQLKTEPLIRIGLSTNSGYVSITTTDSQLVAVSPDEANKYLATNKITVSARAYRPPEIEIYNFEIPNLETSEQAAALAKDIRDATGEQTVYTLDAATGTWKVRIGAARETIEEAEDFKATLDEKGIEDVAIVTEKRVQASDEAIDLSKQIAKNPKSEVRSLKAGRPRVAGENPNNVTTTAATTRGAVSADAVNPNLREVIVSGLSESAKYTSLKPIAFGSFNEKSVSVKLNGKAYRGKIEVFVNSRGSLTVVNVVPLEDYLLGVVPNELGLPQIEAQKAQAVAARTYAVANINGFGKQGFDLLPTVRSQVYRGVSSENSRATQAVLATRGIVATYKGVPINALYTSTCGGRTENSGNVFDFDEPYLRGVECSLEGHKQFEPFLIKTQRIPARLRDEQNVELVRLMSLFAVNGFQLSVGQMTDDYFEDAPTKSELSNWLNQLAARFGKTFPNVNDNSGKPAELAKILATMIYGDAYADTLLSDSDINYQLSFDDAAEIPKQSRADVAILMRDGYFAVYPDLTLKPQKAFSRAKMLRLIRQIYEKKKWLPALQTGTAQPSENGNLIIKSGKSSRTLTVRPDVFLLRQFGDEFYPVKETALTGGENVRFQTDAAGAVNYLEVMPSDEPTSPEKMSPFTSWNTTLSASVVRSRLSRYVRGLGNLIDVNVVQQGYSRRATDLEIITTSGTFHLKGGKIRSALRLNEQLFVINKRYGANNTVVSYTFTGRGWGHGVGMCQYGAYGLAKMGVKYDAILKHYYTGIELTKAY